MNSEISKRKQVFISGRNREMEKEKNAVAKAVSELWTHEQLPLMVWDWNGAKEIPSGNHSDEIQTKGVTESDIYVLILGSEYGEDFEYGESPTHKEYKTACSEIEHDCILVFIKDVMCKEDNLTMWINEFKEARKPTYASFKNPDELLNLVKNRLRQLNNKRMDNYEVVINEALHVPQLYSSNSKIESFYENFDAGELNINLKGDTNSKLFMSFLISSIFHNKTESNITINDINLTVFFKDKKIFTILNRIKLGADKWTDYDSNEFTCIIEKQSSKKIFFRFISSDFLDEPEVSINLILDHTFGYLEVSGCSNFITEIDAIKWAENSSGGRRVPNIACYQNNDIPSFGTASDRPRGLYPKFDNYNFY